MRHVSPAQAFVRLCRTRYLSLTVPPFVIGCVGSDAHTSYLVVGVVAIVLLRGISSIGNCITDRIEDGIDHPMRAELCEAVGYQVLRQAIKIMATIYLGLIVTMVLFLGTMPVAGLVWIAFLLLKLAYSFGPRLKPKRLSATVLLGGVSGGMLFLGWIGDGFGGALTAIFAGMLLWAMGASLVGSKDAPNLEGDEAIGYRSIYRDLVEGDRPLHKALLIVSRPYLAAIGLSLLSALTQGPGFHLLWSFLVFPAAVALALALVRAHSVVERSLVREMGYLYWILFMDVTLIAVVPRAVTVAVAACAILWYFAATRLAHPDPILPGRTYLHTTQKLLGSTA